MSSKYQPQLPFWSSDYLKLSYPYVVYNEERLRYADDTYCILSRIHDAPIFFFMLIVGIFIFSGIFFSVCLYDGGDYFISRMNNDMSVFLCLIVGLLILLISCNFFIFELYEILFHPKDRPIVLNRYTGKVYINDSPYFTMRFFRNPFNIFKPLARRIEEYDWDDIQCVGIRGSSIAATATPHFDVCMVLKPNTNEVKSHFVLGYAVSGPNYLWDWMGAYMAFNKEVKLNDVVENSSPSLCKAKWPKWMQEAMKVQSLEEVIEIKEKYGIDASNDKQKLQYIRENNIKTALDRKKEKEIKEVIDYIDKNELSKLIELIDIKRSKFEEVKALYHSSSKQDKEISKLYDQTLQEYEKPVLKFKDILELMEQYRNGEKSIEGFWDDKEKPKRD